MDNQGKLVINAEEVPALYLKDETMIEFRDPGTMRGGRIGFKREGQRLLVEFIDLDPGVEPIKAIEDPVEAANILAIVDYVIQWIENLNAVFRESTMRNTLPIGFDGLPVLKKLSRQLRLEVGEDELY